MTFTIAIMILFPNAKINIGLEIIRKREDHFHDLETIFYPTSLCDILEILPSEKTRFSASGLPIEGNTNDNLVIKAYEILRKKHQIGNINIHLHKQIPSGAGLGGGSSDAAFMLKGLNELFCLNIPTETLQDYASILGSDCAFFIGNTPVFAQGKGNLFSDTDFSLSGYTLVIIKPGFSVNTAMAYKGVTPNIPDQKLTDLIKLPISEWRSKILNRFEESVFKAFPEIGTIKEKLYSKGAIYASMSGSGSSVFGLFNNDPKLLESEFEECFIHAEIIA
jgi:4-diphosphocytidyl-2-C-methyl-D-erythritol kinase